MTGKTIGEALIDFARIVERRSDCAQLKEAFKEQFPAIACRIFERNKVKPKVFPMSRSEYGGKCMFAIRLGVPMAVCAAVIAGLSVWMHSVDSGSSESGSSSSFVEVNDATNYLSAVITGLVTGVVSYPACALGELGIRKAMNFFGFRRETKPTPSEVLNAKLGRLIEMAEELQPEVESPLSEATKALREIRHSGQAIPLTERKPSEGSHLLGGA